jgi:molybdenum cofactor guanylyltransferase
MASQTKVTGVILAGGLARRMDGQDKGLVLCQGRPLVSYAIAAMNAVADQAIINANRNIVAYQAFGLPVISDLNDDFDGPLAGILAAMDYAQDGFLLVMPCDAPLFKAEHLQALLRARAQFDADIAVACAGQKLHPVFLALKARLKANLQDYLLGGQRKVATWLEQHDLVKVEFNDTPDIFTNINTMQDLYRVGLAIGQG